MSLGISSADIVQQLRRRFGLKGAVDLTVEQSIIPVANIATLDDAPFNAKGGGVTNVSMAATAAQFSYVGLDNPEGSQMNVVVRKLFLWASAQMQTRMLVLPERAAGSLFSSTTAFGVPSWDSDENPQIPFSGNTVPGTMKKARAGSFAAIAAADLFTAGLGWEWTVFAAGGASPVQLELPFCVRPGNILIAQGKTVNTTLNGTFFWDEYPVE
jgi:hypothetical protein